MNVQTRRCIGSTRFGIEAHEAPATDFPAQPSQKDGLGRMCKAHWRQYTNGLRKAALARKADGDAAPKPAAAKPARRSKVDHPMAHAGRKPKAAKAPKEPKAEPAKVREAKALLGRIDKMPGPESVKAIGTDEAQAALDTVNGSRGIDLEDAPVTQHEPVKEA